MGAICGRFQDMIRRRIDGNAQSDHGSTGSSSTPHSTPHVFYEDVVVPPRVPRRRQYENVNPEMKISDAVIAELHSKRFAFHKVSESDVHIDEVPYIRSVDRTTQLNDYTPSPGSSIDEDPPYRERLSEYLVPSDLPPPDDPDTRPVYAVPTSDSKQMALAVWKYDATHKNDMCFKKGDIMQLSENKEDDGWLYGRNVFTGEEGYVPKNLFVMIARIDIESLRCFFKDMSRQTADAKLSEPEIHIGIYLIRSSEDGHYALSIRCENANGQPVIRHFKLMYSNEIGNGIYYISGKTKFKVFDNIVDLILYYTNTNDLQCKLKEPLPREITLDDYAIRFSMIKLGDELGTGNFGSVYAGTLHGSTQVAVKLLEAQGTMTVKEFRKEAETMHRLRHPNLVSLLAICEGNLEFQIVTERMSKGDLLNLLRKNTDGTITLKDLMEMAIQVGPSLFSSEYAVVAEGMCYMEEEGFVHRDIRASNILIGDEFVTKIGDFGLARPLGNHGGDEMYYKGDNESAFPVTWTAPEAVRSQKFTSKSDVWSFGILLYEMVTRGGESYAEISTEEVVSWVEKGNRLQVPTQHPCPSVLYSVMKQCWMKNAEDRSSIANSQKCLLDVKKIA